MKVQSGTSRIDAYDHTTIHLIIMLVRKHTELMHSPSYYLNREYVAFELKFGLDVNMRTHIHL